MPSLSGDGWQSVTAQYSDDEHTAEQPSVGDGWVLLLLLLELLLLLLLLLFGALLTKTLRQHRLPQFIIHGIAKRVKRGHFHPIALVCDHG